VEHNDIIQKWLDDKNIAISVEKVRSLNRFAEMVYEANKTVQLSGHKDLKLIKRDLVVNSLEPVLGLDVPRGTFFGDLGTGSGVPGIPIAIVFDHIRGVLFDSNSRKVEFVKSVIQELGISNIEVECGRIEEIGHEFGKREKFNLVFSRAFNDVFITFELAAPLLIEGGVLFIYASDTFEDLSSGVKKHVKNLGLSACNDEGSEYNGLVNKGIVVKKISKTDAKFPRRFPVMLRESRKVK